MNKRLLQMFGLAILCANMVQAQDYPAFKRRLQEEEKKYRETVVCEKATKTAIHNLNELIWAKPNVDKIVKSCDFIRNQKNGCPQSELLNLLSEIKTAYQSVNTNVESIVEPTEENAPVSNMPDTLVSPEEELQQQPKALVKPIEVDKPYSIYAVLTLLSLVSIWLIYKALQKKTITYLPNSSQIEQNMRNELLEKLGNEDLIAILKEMRDEIGLLRRKISSLEEDVQLLKQKQESQESAKNTEGQTKIYIKPRSVEAEEKHLPKEDSVPIVEMPVVSARVSDNFERRYALYMDNSEGFSVSGLMYSESAETIYELVLTSTHAASYRICANVEAQAYALSDPGYYLRTACDYDNSPGSGSGIETLQVGQLEQVGSIWKITRKARIRFVN